MSYFHFAFTSAGPLRHPGSWPTHRKWLLGFSVPLISVITQLYPLLHFPYWTVEKFGHVHVRTDLAKQVKNAILYKCDVSGKKKLKKKNPQVYTAVFLMQLFMTAVPLFMSFPGIRYIPFLLYIRLLSTPQILITPISHHSVLLWESQSYRVSEFFFPGNNYIFQR